MLLALVLLPIAAILYIDNPNEIVDGLKNMDPALVNIWGGGGITLLNLMTIGGLLFIGLGFMGSPQVFVRFMSIKDEKELNKGRWVAILFTIITDSAAVLVGIFGRYLLLGDGDVESLFGNGAQNVLPMLVEHIFPMVVIGIYVAAVLSAIMSTVDSLLVVASSAITRDFYQKIFHPNLTDTQLASTSRWVTLAIAVISLGIAMTISFLVPGRTIFWFVIFGWSGIAAAFCPVIILSLFYKNYTEKGAIASMITGFLCVPFFKFVAPGFSEVGVYFSSLAELFPSFAVAMIIGIVVSKIKPAYQ